MFYSMEKNSMKKLVFLTMVFGMFLIVAGNVSAQKGNLSFSQASIFQDWKYQGNFMLFDIGQEIANVKGAGIEGNLQKICSKDGGEEMDISWKNNTKMTLRINWVNSKCQEETNDREIKPGEVYDGSSYVGHWFMIRDFKTGKKLGYREVQAQYANMGIPK